ncbi:hypothetical protein JNK13_06460 [bacterium]|nr:hypothetical protein [bacterium]
MIFYLAALVTNSPDATLSLLRSFSKKVVGKTVPDTSMLIFCKQSPTGVTQLTFGTGLLSTALPKLRDYTSNYIIVQIHLFVACSPKYFSFIAACDFAHLLGKVLPYQFEIFEI